MVLKKFSRLKNSTKVDHWQWNNTNANAKAASRVNFPQTHVPLFFLSFHFSLMSLSMRRSIHMQLTLIFFPFVKPLQCQPLQLKMNSNTAKCRITANSRYRNEENEYLKSQRRRFSYNLVRQELLLRNDRRRARTSELYFRPLSSDGSTLTLSSDELQPVNMVWNQYAVLTNFLKKILSVC